MLRTISPVTSPIIWIDASDPSPEEITLICEKFRLDSFVVRDSMNPENFPRFDRLAENLHFLILRIYDEGATAHADTVRELTRKIAIFYGPGFLFTVHRRELDWLTKIEKDIDMFLQKKNAVESLVTKIFQEAVHHFDAPIQAGNRVLESFEQKVFGFSKSERMLEELYFNKRRAAVFREMLDLSSDLLTDNLFFNASNGRNQSIIKNLKSEILRLHFYADKLYDSISGLIHLHLSLASHRTNEVMRILTVFSAFFLPLTFIVGVYGMNFHFMPELDMHYGYHMVWGFMLVVCVGIYYWFRRRGFM